jgi:gas vesicle protein
MFPKKLLIGLLSAAVVVASAGLVTAQTHGTDTTEEAKTMSKAWYDYLKAVEKVTQTLQGAPAYTTDPTGMIDLQGGMIITNIMSQFSSAGSGPRANRPRWSFFDTPDVRIGVDNPDTRYLSAVAPNGDGQNVYRVYGNRSNSCDMIHLVLDPANPMGGGATLEDEDMKNLAGTQLQLGEDYETYFSTAALRDSAWFNWLEIPESDELAIHHRYTVCNYHTERPGDVFIERVGTEGVAVTPEEWRDIPALTEGILRGTAVMENQQPFWAGFADLIQNSGLPPNVVAPWGATGALGITSQLTTNSWLDIPDGMALVVKVRNDYPGAYGSFMLYNAWGSSLPWGHHMANGSFEISGSPGNSYFVPGTIPEDVPAQLCPSPPIPPPAVPALCEDKLWTTIVISNEDPVSIHPITGEDVVPQNWMGTFGFKPVYLAGRLQSVPNNGDPNDPMNPFNMVQGPGPWMAYALPLVPIAFITPGSPVLPADTSFITTDERSAQIRERQIYQSEKYAPW